MTTLPDDLYEVLELPNHLVSQEQITAAFRRLRKEDPLGLPENAEQQKLIGQAYEVLSHADSRDEYDDYLKGKSRVGSGLKDATFRRRPQPPPGQHGQGPSPHVYAYPVPAWQFDSMAPGSKFLTIVSTFITVTALIVTVAVGSLLFQISSCVALAAATCLLVRWWPDMRLAQRIWVSFATTLIFAVAAIVIRTWPLTLHILIGIAITAAVIGIIRVAMIFF